MSGMLMRRRDWTKNRKSTLWPGEFSCLQKKQRFRSSEAAKWNGDHLPNCKFYIGITGLHRASHQNFSKKTMTTATNRMCGFRFAFAR
jgi:hypothetical protein